MAEKHVSHMVSAQEHLITTWLAHMLATPLAYRDNMLATWLANMFETQIFCPVKYYNILGYFES